MPTMLSENLSRSIDIAVAATLNPKTKLNSSSYSASALKVIILPQYQDDMLKFTSKPVQPNQRRKAISLKTEQIKLRLTQLPLLRADSKQETHI